MFHVKRSEMVNRIVSRETMARLTIFSDLLLQWNRTINLISRRDEPNIWERHIPDALGLAPLIPPTIAHAIDLGSGAGFPGLVLAIATGIRFDLVESDQRKAAFLREAGRHTGAEVTVHATRIEVVNLPRAPLITARALAPLPVLLGWAQRLLLSDGICIFPKGRGADTEFAAAQRDWSMHVKVAPSITDTEGRIFIISEIARVQPSA